MKLFVLPHLLARGIPFSALIFVLIAPAACSNTRLHSKASSIPSKVFQYAYQEPSREIVNSVLSRHLSNGKNGDSFKINESRKKLTIRLGSNYYSANGNLCRKFIVNPANEKVACKINNHWFQARPVLVKK